MKTCAIYVATEIEQDSGIGEYGWFLHHQGLRKQGWKSKKLPGRQQLFCGATAMPGRSLAETAVNCL
jgi:hypothetical protein